MEALPSVSERAPARYPYFPTRWQAVIWRNWGLIPADRIARALKTSEENVRAAAGQLGLDPALGCNPEWEVRGYITVIRENWHLCSFEQITTMLEISDEKLAFLLKEDDFLWHKMGQIKPLIDPETVYAPLTPAELDATRAIAGYLPSLLPYEDIHSDNAFDFVKDFTRELTPAERAEAKSSVEPSDGLRTIYSYFALYGDPLIDASLDPFPEGLLAEYAKMGVKGVWLQGLLYQLVKFPFAPEMSEGCEVRIENLRSLVKRAAEYGIGVYIYMNEPRAMNDAFFKKYPDLRGIQEGDFYAMCTSRPEVTDYLESAMYELFSSVSGLAGFFTITMSENLTNCYSRSSANGPCPRCSKRKPEEVIADVNNALARGAHRANPAARAVAWNWAWGEEWADKVPALLTEDQIVQCTSEERLPTNIAGVKGYVVDYTMSLCGPGPKAKRVWKAAIEAGRQACAKVQLNNTWEMSAAPWLPVFDRVAKHIGNLKENGVEHLQMSWTLGGYPSPNLKLAGYIMSGKGDVSSFTREWLGTELGGVADRAQALMSEAFTEFPFHISLLYTGPMNYGPMAPFFLEKTGWRASMIGFPYDDLDSWRAIYPRETLREQFRLLTEGWQKGVELMQAHLGKSAEFDDMARMAKAAYIHFMSSYNSIRFVMARDAGETDELKEIVASERALVVDMIALRREDSRLGYEASNHYYYSMQDLLEKLINLKYVEDQLK